MEVDKNSCEAGKVRVVRRSMVPLRDFFDFWSQKWNIFETMIVFR